MLRRVHSRHSLNHPKEAACELWVAAPLINNKTGCKAGFIVYKGKEVQTACTYASCRISVIRLRNQCAQAWRPVFAGALRCANIRGLSGRPHK
jgi:hypothetical protein